jgi:hypothetical protein
LQESVSFHQANIRHLIRILLRQIILGGITLFCMAKNHRLSCVLFKFTFVIWYKKIQNSQDVVSSCQTNVPRLAFSIFCCLADKCSAR